MHNIIKQSLICFFMSVTFCNANAKTGESDIKAAIEPLLNGDPVQKISELKNSGIYEVITENNIYYTDKSGSILIASANAIDTKTKENLTISTNAMLGSFDFKSLPLHNAIKTVRGNGTRKIVTFEDVNCGYCKRLMSEFNNVRDVTVYTFLVGIMSPDSERKAQSIWCSPDHGDVWRKVMSDPTFILSAKDCTNPLKENLALFSKLRLRGTPAILFDSNTKVPGYLSAAQIESKLKPQLQ